MHNLSIINEILQNKHTELAKRHNKGFLKHDVTRLHISRPLNKHLEAFR